jgi:hypothetical protein
MRLYVSKAHDFVDAPDVIGESRFNRKRNAERLVDAGWVVMRKRSTVAAWFSLFFEKPCPSRVSMEWLPARIRMPSRPGSRILCLMPRTPKPKAPAPRTYSCAIRPSVSHYLMAGVQSNDPDALFEMGRLYSEGTADRTGGTHDENGVRAFFIRGIPRDPIAAQELLQKAAEQGHLQAKQLLDAIKLEATGAAHKG